MKRWVAILSATLVPAMVCAQEGAGVWPGLEAQPRSTVYVEDDTGVKTTGVQADIRLIEKPPSLRALDYLAVRPPALPAVQK